LDDADRELREADHVIDIHLLNMALAGIGIGVGVAVVIAAAIIAFAALAQHRGGLRGHASSRATARGPEQEAIAHGHREPALR
jgi:nucleoside permease NupC